MYMLVFRSMDKITLEPFVESAGSPSDREVILTIIEAGWGNTAHNHYYPAETLERAAKDGVFNGVRMFADHLSEGQRRLLGHLPRSVKDITGRIKETWYDAPTRSLKGRAKLVPWFYDLVKSDIGLVEASINAGGHAKSRTIGGKTGRFVEAIVQAESVDWVSTGGAGGRIDSLLEAHMEEQISMYEDLTLDALVEGKPSLIKEILEGPLNERAATAEAKIAELEGKVETLTEAAATAEATAETTPEAETAPVVETLTEAQIDARIEEKVAAGVQAVLDARDADIRHDKAVDKLLEADEYKDLPAKARLNIASQFHGKRAEFETMESLTEAVDAAAKQRQAEIQEALGTGRVSGLGPTVNIDQLREAGTPKAGSKINDLIDQKFGIDEPAPKGETAAA